MKHTEQEAILIAKLYQKRNPKLQNKIVSAKFNEDFDVEGKAAWIVTGIFDLQNKSKDFFYVVSDKTGLVEYVLNENGIRIKNPQLKGA